MNKKPRFTPFYEYFAQWPELDLPEALVLSRIKMWGNAGCYESYETMAQALKLNRSTVIRAARRLLQKELILVLYPKKQKRIFIFNVEKFTNMPLFSSKKLVAQSHHLHKTGGTEPPVNLQSGGRQPPDSSTEPPELVAQCASTISSKHLQDRQNSLNSLSEIMTTHQAKPRTPAEIQKWKRQQFKKLGLLDKGK